jgi:hypothetical protein
MKQQTKGYIVIVFVIVFTLIIVTYGGLWAATWPISGCTESVFYTDCFVDSTPHSINGDFRIAHPNEDTFNLYVGCQSNYPGDVGINYCGETYSDFNSQAACRDVLDDYPMTGSIIKARFY